MSIETPRNSEKNNKVNVYTLKTQVLAKEKKEKLQSKIIYLSIFVSIGIISYLVI